MNSVTAAKPRFHYEGSRLHDQGIFYIHCRVDTIRATGTVVQANFFLVLPQKLWAVKPQLQLV